MNSPPKTIPFERYLAIDAHKRYVMVGGLNVQQEQVLLARKIEVKDYPKLAQAKLKPGDARHRTVPYRGPGLAGLHMSSMRRGAEQLPFLPQSSLSQMPE